ncbi:unnamed protein product [Merluccius merluccius]
MEPYKANYFPSNRNITVKIEAGPNVTPQVYVRDLAITAVVCFTGGVGLTLMVVLIHYRVSRRRKEKTVRREREEEEEEGERPEKQEYSAWERQKELTFPGDSRKSWDGQADILDQTTPEISRVVGNSGSHFRCPHCRGAGLEGRGRRTGGVKDETLAEVQQERWRMREEEGEERRSGMRPHKGALNPNMVANGGPGYPHPSARPPQGILRPYKTGPGHYRTDGDLSGRELGPYRTNGDLSGREPGPYRTDGTGREPGHYRTDGPSTSGWEEEDKGEDHSSTDRRGRRNVTFYLERPLDPRKEGSRRSGEKKRSKREKRGEGEKREGRHKTRVQSSRLLRVKLNLSPVRRNKVHPRKSSERRHLEERSSRREGRGGEGKKDNRLDGKGNKGGGRKGKSNKTMKTIKSKKPAEEDNGDEERCKEGQNKKTSQQSSEPDHHVSVETTDQSEPSRAPEGLTHTNGERLNLQLGPPPFPPSVPASASLLGIPNSARPGPGPRLSLHANLPQTPSGIVFNSHINSSLGANVAYPGLHGLNQNIAAPADTQSLALQRGLRPSASAASLLASPEHGHLLLASPGRSHPLLGRAVSTPSIYASQSGEVASSLALNPTMNPAHIIQSLSRPQLPPENIPLVPRPTENIPLVPRPTENIPLVPRPTENINVVPRPTENINVVPRPTENIPVDSSSTADPPQGPGLQAGEEPHALAPVAGLIGAGPSGDAGGGDEGISGANRSEGRGPVVGSQSAVVAPPGGVATIGNLCSGQTGTAEKGVTSAPVENAEEGVATAGSQALLQQEYLSEDGGSSPRRKLKLVLPEKASNRPPTALERKIR